ncbi:BRCT domain-containing protein [Cinnamomum micranthum f. kanehirae]|uniref:DNA polymerase n=1 Tax=Cinnamomum micranthum f. kanehirae TaxID=337451 RepID=A0A443NF49_9MAGN|nr:BRCT domain-containing protein [Cinnamomum micranthum f. kanehirae]
MRMAPKAKNKAKKPPSSDPQGMFKGMIVFLVGIGVQTRRLEIWKQKLIQMGATIEDYLSKKVTHIFAMNSNALLQKLNRKRLMSFKGNILSFQWLEDSLTLGEKTSEDSYCLKLALEKGNELSQPSEAVSTEAAKGYNSDGKDDEASSWKKTRTSEFLQVTRVDDKTGTSSLERNYLITPEHQLAVINGTDKDRTTVRVYMDPSCPARGSDAEMSSQTVSDAAHKEYDNVVLVPKALGDDRRSFSYHKAIPVIEKLPFKIESVDQVKHLPAIGKSMQDHIQEIVTTGKLSKLEHFETDEKVRTVTLFGEVWGIGPATALKLYEKGHRTLDDLKNEDSLTSAQKLGLKFFDDIKKRVPRYEVKDMEVLLQKVGQDLLPGVILVCGGSYRRGKATCGDLDIIITHPDGTSHRGFLVRYVQCLKDIKFLREDLIFSTHSMEGTDSGVDTYFGLCTYPGREQRHRIDLKVYPRDIYAFGLIAWTGNDVLNRRLRLLAESKGYRLDDTGLFLATQSSAGKRGAKSSISLSCKTEREVFDVLGFPWLEPHERNL